MRLSLDLLNITLSSLLTPPKTYSINLTTAPYDDVTKSSARSIKFSRKYTETKSNCLKFPKSSLSLRNIDNVFYASILDIKKNKMTALALLDKIEDEVGIAYEKLEKSNKAISDFNTKIKELQNYKYLLFKAR